MIARIAVAALLAIAIFAGCGGNESTTTVTETTQAPSTTSSTTSTTEATTSEATTTSVPDQEEPTAGETADLPLCSERPAPCRDDASGEVIEPGENGGGGVVAP